MSASSSSTDHSANAHNVRNNVNNVNNNALNVDSKNIHHQQQQQGRPPLRNNFDQEPNPFEQSFSVSSSTPLSSFRNANGSNQEPSPTSDRKSPSATSNATQGSSHSRKTSLNNIQHPNGDTPKPTLPPLASITSPSDPSYAWSFSSAGLTNSLRSGPLSPAMLAGPQAQPPVSSSQPATSVAALAASASSMHPPLFGFDPSGSFRTGLTPSTGLTPLVGGPVAFPPPSPNTAAFLAMVNSGAATGSTITPNTLNALTGVLQQQHTASTAQQQQQHQQQQHINGSSTVPPVSAQSQMPSSAQSYSNGQLSTQRYASNTDYPFSESEFDNSNSYSGTNGAANHTTNGLFLLSQAHQELTKREEAQKQSLAQSNGSANAKGSNTQNQTQVTSNGSSAAKRGSKRKGDTASISSSTSTKVNGSKRSKFSASSNTRGATRRGSTAASISNPDGEDDGLDEYEESDEDSQVPPQSTSSNKNKKPETEEEKRKNFLERNRQAALKCRQRKKQWLAQLQAKNEYLTNENERLTAALVSSREEISRLSQLVGGAGIGLPVNSQGVGVGVGVPIVGVGMGAVQQHHAPYIAHQQSHHPVSVPVSIAQSTPVATATSPPVGTRASPHMQQQSPHSPASDGRSSRSSLRDARDYGNGREASNGRDYVRDMRERELGQVHSHAPQAVAVNGRGYGY